MTAGYACFPILMYRNETLTTVIHRSEKGTPLASRMAKLEANPARAAALAKARQRVGIWMAQENLSNQGLTTLRLQAGLSQKKLAELIGTQQSNVSRMERAPGDLQLSTLKSLASAFNVTVSKVIEAIEADATECAHHE